MTIYRHHPARGRMALARAGAALTACAALTASGSGVASAAVHPRRAKQAPVTATATTTTAKVTETDWGTANGRPVELYTLHGAGGIKVNISEFGSDIQSIDVPDKDGKLTDVVLGFPNLADHVADFEQGADLVDWPIANSTSGTGDSYFGATIGEYANRIAGGTFPLNGTTYKLDLNNGPNDLHGGYLGWNTTVWSGTPSVSGTT